jgi:DNA-binding NtrC family response regulator
MNGPGGRILLVEDEPAAVRVATIALQRESFGVTAVGDAPSALARLHELRPDVVVCDYLLPGLSGLELLRHLQRRAPDLPVVFITGHGDERLAVEAMKLGAFTYLPKPLDYDELAQILRRAVETSRLRREFRGSQVAACADGMVGESEAIQELKGLITDVAPTDVTVLVLGETGTGKELVARAIHAGSPRAKRRLVAVNCAAIPETLLEAELFGWVKGAFTGAEGRREGKFAVADRGTLFLDEIGDLPLSLQAKLLRVLEERAITPLGSDESRAVDVRLVAATHRDLKAEVDAGRFRADLFYRLNVVPLRIPPLRERRGDIPLLVRHLLRALATRHGKVVRSVDPTFLAWLTDQPWPGNVRELENALERTLVRCRDGVLRAPAPTGALLPPFRHEKQRLIDEFEREYLTCALARCSHRLSDIAERTGISPRQLYNLLHKHGLVDGREVVPDEPALECRSESEE